MKSPTLSSIVQNFFQQYLVGERNLSPNTVLSYRDAVSLLLRFTSRKTGRDPDKLSLDDFDAQHIRDFLGWLEKDRACSPRTCNQRLAAMKAFFRYVASVTPEHLDRCRQVRELANRRFNHPSIPYLDSDEVKKLLEGVNLSSRHGLRDLTLLTFMLNTGARVQEVINVNIADLRLEANPKVRLRGKGRKERDCPLWGQTVKLLRRWLKQRGADLSSPEALFVNAQGLRLSRSGVSHILRRRAAQSQLEHPRNLDQGNISPHTIRHTTAMELLKSGVDITTIAAWLGHAQLSTTHHYIEIDLRMKQAAIADAEAVLPPDLPVEYPAARIIEWLESLSRGQDYVQRSSSETIRDGPQTAQLRITQSSA